MELIPEDSGIACIGIACITVPYEKKVVASQLGMRPETLSRALAKLRKLGVQSYHSAFIIIEDIGRLRTFCHWGDFSNNKEQSLTVSKLWRQES